MGSGSDENSKAGEQAAWRHGNLLESAS
jgi:hypothetical protein